MDEDDPYQNAREEQENVGPRVRGQSQQDPGEEIPRKGGGILGPEKSPEQQEIEKDDQRGDQQLRFEVQKRPIERGDPACDHRGRSAEHPPSEEVEQHTGERADDQLDEPGEVEAVSEDPVQSSQEIGIERRPEEDLLVHRVAAGDGRGPGIVPVRIHHRMLEERIGLDLLEIDQPYPEREEESPQYEVSLSHVSTQRHNTRSCFTRQF